MKLKILFLGENWFGSCARACAYALRRLDCEVRDIDGQTFFPQVRRLGSRMALRLLERRLIREFNDIILDVASTFRPDLLLAFKGPQVEVGILQSLREQKIALYNYYPDTSAFAHGALLERSLPEYDCVFYTKRFWDRDVQSRIRLRASMFVPHGYDPEVHYSWPLSERDTRQYGHDVGVIGTHTPHKEDLLTELLTMMPNADLRIWGNLWAERCRSPLLKRYIVGSPLLGSDYAKALQAIRINLAIMSGVASGASQGDETTTRTFEIPACGTFMLHERSHEVLDLYEEGKEIACFGSAAELSENIVYYLGHTDEREVIAGAGRRRCVPAYAYDNRMAEILKWHYDHCGQEETPERLPAILR
ncbi:MAG: glycosyltransferase [Acidobacteria bacterium]|nr:glycosyltransferase [Acidobacteriota bacterium]MBI3657590.1 glycosyltransferase [Acidobacteriota bacterium]